jgi:NAD-dependent deacetylase
MERLINHLADPDCRITVLTGAGISAASGVPTFRGEDGLWKGYDPMQLATPEAFRKDPALVWEWYDWRRQLVAQCEPNAGHEVIAAWSRRYEGFTLITQNVDGLHERAGTINTNRFHGSLWEVGCWNGCEQSPLRWKDETVPFPKIPPTCIYCGGLIRPGVVWFGESIPLGVVERSSAAVHCDVFFTIGTSAVVHPAAGLIEAARSVGAFTVEINPDPTPATHVMDLVIAEGAEVALPGLEELIR